MDTNNKSFSGALSSVILVWLSKNQNIESLATRIAKFEDAGTRCKPLKSSFLSLPETRDENRGLCRTLPKINGAAFRLAAQGTEHGCPLKILMQIGEHSHGKSMRELSISVKHEKPDYYFLVSNSYRSRDQG